MCLFLRLVLDRSFVCLVRTRSVCLLFCGGGIDKILGELRNREENEKTISLSIFDASGEIDYLTDL